MTRLDLNRDQFLELQKIGIGAFAPLKGFMNEPDLASVAESMRLASGEIFPLPVFLDLSDADAKGVRTGSTVELFFQSEKVGTLEPQSVYGWDKAATAKRVFAVSTPDHPGVARMLRAGDTLVGGPVTLTEAGKRFMFPDELSPTQTKAIFAERGWKTVAGFQTRNVPHRAHEYLQRVALEVCDGLFIQPLVGRKKAGDYTPEAIMSAYRVLSSRFLPPERVVLGVLSTSMRYAGPREAVFHALIRRNYGCTHFIVGRDHAGVGSFYGKYESQNLALRHADELGIKILALSGPLHCRACDSIVTEKTCNHVKNEPEATTEISGTIMRGLLRQASTPHPELMRPEIVAALDGIPIFVEQDDA